ncbi:hypothetical protein LCGC14_1078060 [marine sediment metagenome]|uniref:Uncharacterized protein n=1 Tax=marine sediment metagenome TaxID=412755 RepID=A0A0F9MKY9_9ZZZZ
MAKVVLIRPQSNTDTFNSSIPRIPLALLYIGSVLKQHGHEVKIIDTNVALYSKVAILGELGSNLDLVGITALTSEVESGLGISQFIKDRIDVPIVWGGIHPSLYPEMTCADPMIDYVVFGDGEYAMLELVEALEAHKPVDDIKGLVYKNKNVVKKNQSREYVNLDGLPAIDYGLIKMDRYFKGDTWHKAIDVQTSRGCIYHCKYCVNEALGNHEVRTLSALKVVDSCELLVKNYGINFVTFNDDNFFFNIKRAREICREIIRRGLNIKWFAEVRADYFRDGFVDNEFLVLAQESGLINLTIGAESGVPEVLKIMDKGITVEDVETSARMLAQTGIATAYSFIIGLPNESKADIMETLKFMEHLDEIYPRGTYSVTTLRAYPGSELTDGFFKAGLIREPKTLREFADHEINKVYTESPSRPVWHSDPDFAYAVARYSSIAYSPFIKATLRANLKHSSILLLPETILQKIARFRLQHQFFWFPVDIHISKLLRRLYYSKLARSIVRWKKNAG